MKKLFTLFIFIATACQHSAPPTQVTTVPLAAPVAAAKPIAATAEAPVPPDSLTPAMWATLRQVNLAKLFLAPESPQAEGYKTALDGFFGTKPQRLSLAILTATRDSLRPELLHVTGKTRYLKQITAFLGDICLTRLTDFYDQNLLLTQGADGFIRDTISEDGLITNAKAYSATAYFRFTSATPAPLVLTGRALLDFWIMDNGTVGTVHTPAEGIVLEKAAAKGSGLVLKGNWQGASSEVAKPFLVSRDVFLVSPDLIGDFGVGDRGAGVNPKYAKLGWNTYWENDEWWADSPKPSLSL